jgi:hypothetical protein
MLEVARRRYDPRYDFIGAEMWFRNIVLKQPMVFLPIRSQDAFAIGMLSTVPWRPQEVECNVAMVCADFGALWQAVTLMRVTLAWARQRKCIKWRVTSETDFDLGPIAHKLGAEKEPYRYVVKLE